MSGTAPHAGEPTPAPQSGAAADPSMEDILASIRRILNEDEVAPGAAHPAPEQPNAGGSGGTDEDEVLVLDEGMLVTPPPVPPGEAPPPVPVEPGPLPATAAPEPNPGASSAAASPTAGLLAPERVAEASSSVSALLRSISQERGSQVHRGGPTIEDLVREEVRPLLKEWLDRHLPPLVERLVRIEIERVTGHAAP